VPSCYCAYPCNSTRACSPPHEPRERRARSSSAALWSSGQLERCTVRKRTVQRQAQRSSWRGPRSQKRRGRVATSKACSALSSLFLHHPSLERFPPAPAQHNGLHRRPHRPHVGRAYRPRL
jgi:hypothetical protein